MRLGWNFYFELTIPLSVEAMSQELIIAEIQYNSTILVHLFI